MKTHNKTLILLLALIMTLTASIPALAETTDADPALGSFHGEPILKSLIDQYIQLLLQDGAIESEYDYAAALDYYTNQQILLDKMHVLGFDVFTDTEIEALNADAQKDWEDAIQSYIDYYKTDDSEDALAQLRVDAEKYFFDNYGYSLEFFQEGYRDSAAWDRLDKYLVGDYLPTEEEIRTTFEQIGEQYKLYYGDAASYEYYSYYGGSELWYRPDGYRAVTHILLVPDDELLTAFNNAQAAYEESLSGTTAEGGETTAPLDTEALKAAVDEAKAAILESKQTQIDDIYTRIEAGESFESLIAEFGEDPGMQDPATLAVGYDVHAQSIMYDAAFVEGAFGEKMLAPGDVSDPVVGSFGVHIVYYKSDIPGGLIDMTDTIHDEIKEYLLSQHSNTKYVEALDSWKQEYEIVYDDAAIALASTPPAETETPTEGE